MRRQESGVVLVSVLALLGIAAALVHLMLAPGEASVARSQRFSEAGQALALVRAGEQSAVAALRRDMTGAPEVDHRAEAWAEIAQAEVKIAGGAFELEIADARDRVNLNALDPAELEDLRVLLGVCAAAGLDPKQAAALAAALERGRPLAGLDDLGPQAGLAPEEIAALGRLAVALPGGGAVNINAAPVEVIAAVLGDASRARMLITLRDRTGFLGPEDVSRLGFELPAAIGFRSDLFHVRTRARVGGTRQVVESLVHRRSGAEGPEVAVVARRTGAAEAPPPPLP